MKACRCEVGSPGWANLTHLRVAQGIFRQLILTVRELEWPPAVVPDYFNREDSNSSSLACSGERCSTAAII